MSNDRKPRFSTEKDYIENISEAVKHRKEFTRSTLRTAFASFLRTESVDAIDFSQIGSHRLTEILSKNPSSLKPVLAYCGIGSRAIARDLGISGLDTYEPQLKHVDYVEIANYLVDWLRGVIPLDVLVEIDRVEFADTRKRSFKGAWEKRVRNTISNESGLKFSKHRFRIALGRGKPEVFEIDLAYPTEGDIRFAIDVKRIEARQDYQKRSDEIVNKAAGLRRLYATSKFAAFIYYPFDPQDVRGRLESPYIDEVVFAGEDDSSIREAANILIKKFRLSNLQSKLVGRSGVRKSR